VITVLAFNGGGSRISFLQSKQSIISLRTHNEHILQRWKYDKGRLQLTGKRGRIIVSVAGATFFL